MSTETERNKAVVRSYFENCWMKADLSFADQIIIEDYDLHLSPGDEGGLAQWKRGMTATHIAFGDIWFENLQLIAEGEMVAARSVIHATHRGEYFGFPATGIRIATRCADFYRVRDGKMIAHWDVPDFLSRLHQLGVIPKDFLDRLPRKILRGPWPISPDDPRFESNGRQPTFGPGK